MNARISVVTLGVDDLDRALVFYRDGLGWRTEGIVGEEHARGAVAFFEMEGGLRLALWPRESIAEDTGIARSDPAATEFTLGHNVGSREEVDAVLLRAEAAGAVIVTSARETFYGGYAGYFQDPDRHLWEVVWIPEEGEGRSFKN